MNQRIWHKGPPPHIGWWNASLNRDEDSWRWWDGTQWSFAAYPSASLRIVAIRVDLKTGVPAGIEWTDYWPENARVPRIKP